MTTMTYKLRGEKHFQTITFEGVTVNVLDFKKGVISQGNYNDKNMERSFDFIITNQGTGEEFRDNKCILPRQALLVVHQIPATAKRASKLWEPQTNPVISLDIEEHGVDATEEWARINTPSDGAAEANTGVKQAVIKPGPSYICFRCGVPGHWIRHCPTNNIKDFVPLFLVEQLGVPTKRSGVPIENPSEKPSRIIVNGRAVSESELSNTRMETPTTFRCDICRSTLRDATVVPCCKKPFCKECIMQNIWLGGQCPVCLSIVKADELQADQPLQERIKAHSEQLKRSLKMKKTQKDEYVQRKSLLSSPQVKQTAMFMSFRHNNKAMPSISCLNCNEKGHVFMNCPKLQVEEEPPPVVSSSLAKNPSLLDGLSSISPSAKHQITTLISSESDCKILEETHTKRHSLTFKREYRKVRKNWRRSSHKSSSTSSSRSRSRTAKKRRRRRSSQKSRRRRSRRSKSSHSRSSESHDYSSSSHYNYKRKIAPSVSNLKRKREDWKGRTLDHRKKEEKRSADHRHWPDIRKPPRPKKYASHSPPSARSSSDVILSLSPPPGWGKHRDKRSKR